MKFYNYLLDATLRAYKTITQEYNKPIFLNVNVAVQQLVQEMFADEFINYIKKFNIDPTLIYIECTEQALETKEEFFTDNIKQLKQFGIKFSIDDFGTGYSSIKRLIEYDFEQIKLDRSFFMGIQNSEKLQSATRVAALFGENLGMEVLAEGIETKEEYVFAQEYEIEFVQGYFLCKPMSVAKTLELLKNSTKD